jgi:hypothetical protein
MSPSSAAKIEFTDYAESLSYVAPADQQPGRAVGSPTNDAPRVPHLPRHVASIISTNGLVSATPKGVIAISGGTLGNEEAATTVQQGSAVSKLVAEWEGHVASIGKKTFEAQLRGISGEGVEGQTEGATIPIAEITEFNKPLFAVGAIFRLCVSYDEYPSGQIRRYTELFFRRLPAYRQRDLDDALKRARERLSELRLE